MAVAALGAGVLTRLTAIVSADTSGFELGPVMKSIEQTNKVWGDMNKKMAPAQDLWNHVTGAFSKLLGIFKDFVAPIALVGAGFFAFLLTGEAARGVLGAVFDIIGAFADVLTSALLPAIEPVLAVLVDLLPKWEAIFGTQQWHDTMVALGAALADLVSNGMNVLLDLVQAVVAVLPTFIGFWTDLIQLLADSLFWLSKHPEFLQAIAQGLTIIAGAIVTLGAAGIIALFAAVAISLGEIGVFVGWLVDHWPEIEGFFQTFKDALPTLQKMVELGDRLVAIYDTFASSLKAAADLLDKIGSATSAAPVSAGQVGDFFSNLFINNLPHFQMGGPVLDTGPAILHAGEFVVPAGGGGGGIGGTTYNVTVPIESFFGSEESIERLAREIGDVMRREAMLGVNTLK